MPYNDAPRVGGDHGFGDQLNIQDWRRYPDVSGDERLYNSLIDLLGTMTAGGPEADRNYSELLERARDDEVFAVLVVKTLDAVEESAYLERWALLQLAIDLQHPATADYLAEFVRRPVPEERAEDTAHGLSTVTEEVILRTTAIEGLARFFRRDYDSTEVLLETVGSADYVALRRAAWFALADAGRDDAVGRARELLERSDFGWIANLRRIPVQEAQQPDPHLIDFDKPPRGDIPAPYDE